MPEWDRERSVDTCLYSIYSSESYNVFQRLFRPNLADIAMTQQDYRSQPITCKT